MKKFKWTLMSLSLTTATTLAFTTAKPNCDSCQQQTQYYYNGSTYVLAGDLGTDYNCVSTGNVCTYTTTDLVHYTPCISSYAYVALPGRQSSPLQKK